MTAEVYTLVTTDNVRAVLGVSVREISDAQIIDLGIRDQLEVKLLTVYPDAATLAASVVAGTATADEQAAWKKLRLYVQYQAAVFMLPQLQNLIVQKITDGDAEMQRFMASNLQDTIDRITGMRDTYLELVNPDLVPTGASVQFISLIIPDNDPVVDL